MLRTSHLAHTAVASLRRNGYAVLDNALTPALASTLLAEIKSMHPVYSLGKTRCDV